MLDAHRQESNSDNSSDTQVRSNCSELFRFVGNTDLFEVNNIDTGLCRLFLKLENRNPGGSIKDRIGVSMIQRAERMGLINQNTHLIEATSGNTGIGLALAAIRSGYKLTLVIPDRVSANKIAHAKALGAEIVITRSDVQRGHPEHFQDYAERLARELPEAFHLDQFRNPGNAEAHEFGTGPEIFRQMEGSVDAIVCGVGSGGTITGVGHCMKKISPHTEMLLADPIGSIVGPTILGEKNPEYQRYMIEGIGSDFIPPLLDREVINQVYQILDQDGLLACRDLMRFEGIHAGTSSGLLLAAALKYCRAQRVPKRVVTFVCDTGDKYFLKVYGVAN